MPLGRRPLLVLLVLPVLGLLAGLLAFGSHADGRTVADVSGDACTQHAPRFGITDDPAEVQRQAAFERRSLAVTATGFYARPTPLTPTLHSASHGSVVVFYRQGLPARKLTGLRALVSAAVATKAPVVVTPRRQTAAFTALGVNQQLTCASADAAQVARVRAFAAAIYPSLKP